jgi:hypothetical protein
MRGLFSNCALGFCLVFAASTAVAQAPTSPPVRIRGVVDKIENSELTVRLKTGGTAAIHLAEPHTIITVVKASLADIAPGAFIGTTALPQNDGTLKAIEIHIFPEAQRGTGEGFRPFDLAPNSTMTNANVASKVESVAGPLLKLTYKGGEQTVVVPPDAAIVGLAPGEAADLHVDVAVSFQAIPQQDGSLQASRITVGKNGVNPPM